MLKTNERKSLEKVFAPLLFVLFCASEEDDDDDDEEEEEEEEEVEENEFCERKEDDGEVFSREAKEIDAFVRKIVEVNGVVGCREDEKNSKFHDEEKEEDAFEAIVKRVNKYQEKCEMLDEHLEKWIVPLTEEVLRFHAVKISGHELRLENDDDDDDGETTTTTTTAAAAQDSY